MPLLIPFVESMVKRYGRMQAIAICLDYRAMYHTHSKLYRYYSDVLAILGAI
jgi:hypothetical protein